jgi:aldehyde dehydrogenase (NAD+)
MFQLNNSITSIEPPKTSDIADEVMRVLGILSIDLKDYGYNDLEKTDDTRINLRTPITGEVYGSVKITSQKETEEKINTAHEYFKEFRTIPAPKRGEFMRIYGNLLREYKNEIGFLVSVEVGKIISEGLGEVQEMIDICDLAVGQSRQLFGKVIASERPGHSMRETYIPLGVVGVVTAFNFPVAVYAWNSALAFICGDPVVFKPSDKCAVSAIAIYELARRAAKEAGINQDVAQLVLGGIDAANALAKNENIALLSVTGSTVAGAALSKIVNERFGKVLLELGGNNATIVTPSADLDLATRAIVFAAAGTAGQRCTTLRRLIIHESIIDEVLDRVSRAFATLKVGNPLSHETLVGPLIEERASIAMDSSLAALQKDGKLVVGSERVYEQLTPNAFYRKPSIVKMSSHTDDLNHETFAPVLTAVSYKTIEEAIELNNKVPQGLSSSIFTTNVKEAELFMSPAGSDCGFANVNIGTSGAEIGGAFGGEKHTGGGRESGSDAWKTYMRRLTSTVNYSDALPLAQGVEFI